jgi:hypothetical protein
VARVGAEWGVGEVCTLKPNVSRINGYVTALMDKGVHMERRHAVFYAREEADQLIERGAGDTARDRSRSCKARYTVA